MTTKTIQTRFKNYGSFLPFELVVVFKKQGDFNEMVKEAAKKYPTLTNFGDHIGPTVMSFVYSPEEDDNTIFLFVTDITTIPVIVHEAVHIVMRVFEIIGSEVTADTEEFFAYLQQMIFVDTLDLLKKMKFTPKMVN